jgi:hypothetical protein
MRTFGLRVLMGFAPILCCLLIFGPAFPADGKPSYGGALVQR